MANIVFNVAKGRVVEYYNRVKSNDPIDSALIVIPVLTANLEADSVLIDSLTVLEVFDDATDEATGSGWVRKTLTNTELAAFPGPDTGNDRYDVSLPTVIWTAVTAGIISKLLVCYDADTAAGTDTNLIPLTLFDFAITPDGSDVQMTTGVFFRAS
jgi:hypothetical protein